MRCYIYTAGSLGNRGDTGTSGMPGSSGPPGIIGPQGTKGEHGDMGERNQRCLRSYCDFVIELYVISLCINHLRFPWHGWHGWTPWAKGRTW